MLIQQRSSRRLSDDIYQTLCSNCKIRSINGTNEMYNSYNQLLFHSFLPALHVSNKSSRSSSGARHNILYCAML